MFNKFVNTTMKENENKEQAILQAAEKEFLARGFDGAKPTAIAEPAGVTHALLHYYFRTKESLVNKVLDNKIELLEASVVDAFANSEAPLPTRIEQGMRRHFQFMLENPDLPRFVVNEFFARPERAGQLHVRLRSLVGRVAGALQHEMRQLAERGEIARVDLPDLLLDIISLNVFPFLCHRVIVPLLAPDLGTDAFFRTRLEENVTVILKRLQPTPSCDSSSSSCSPVWLP